MSSISNSTIFPNRLRRYRKERNLLVRDIARLVGILNPGHVWQWESGRRTPTLKTAMKLAAAMDYPVELLFPEDFDAIRREVGHRRQRLEEKKRVQP